MAVPVPSDARDPVTADWLEATGWRRWRVSTWDATNPASGDFVRVCLAAGFPEVSVGNHDGRSVGLCGFGRKATRGQLVTLLAALNIVPGEGDE